MKQLYVAINDLSTLNKLNKEMVSGVIVNSASFSSGLSSHELSDILEAFNTTDFKCIIRLDRLYNEEEIEEIKERLKQLADNGIYGVLCTDLAVKVIVEEMKLDLKVIYAPETLLTNYLDIQELRNEGFDHCVISKDIPLNDAYEIINQVPDYCWLRIHGPILLSYSLRRFVSSYLEKPDNEPGLYELQESTREDRLPFIEKKEGSWLYGTCLESFSEFNKLQELPVAGLLIDNAFMNDENTLKVLELYEKVYKDPLFAPEALKELAEYDETVEYSSLREIKKTILEKER